MPRTMHLFAITMLAIFAFSTPVQAEPVVGDTAPDFTGTNTLSGKPIALHDLKGKLVVLEWNNFECPFIGKFYSKGAMQSLQAKAKKDGIVWISINSSGEGKEGYLPGAAEAKSAIAERHAVPAYFLLDHAGTIGHLYGAKNTPTMFVINKDGVLAYRGAIDNKPSTDPVDIPGATNYVTAALTDLKAGHAVKTASTQAYGCYVHY